MVQCKQLYINLVRGGNNGTASSLGKLQSVGGIGRRNEDKTAKDAENAKVKNIFLFLPFASFAPFAVLS
jgi:hypothetical protein